MYHFIINKNASSGQAMKTWEDLREILNENSILYREHFPSSVKECVSCIHELEETAQSVHLVVIGGDGSLNVVLQGIRDFKNTTLSCIPVGSGNDFARALHISTKPRLALRHLLKKPEEIKMDYGVVTYTNLAGKTHARRFIISAGVGYDAEVCEEVDRSRAKKFFNHLGLGQVVYGFIGLKKIFSGCRKSLCNQCDVRIQFEDSEPRIMKDMFLCVSMNTPYQGGGAPFCPSADWKDGALDFCTVDNMSAFKLLFAVLAVYIKQHLRFREVRNDRSKSMTMHLSKPRWLHVDGDPQCEANYVRTESKSGLRFIY